MLEKIGVKAAIFGIVALAVVTVIALGYRHYSNLVEENKTLHENEVKLKESLETERQTVLETVKVVQEWKAAEQARAEATRALEASTRSNAEQLRRLNDVLSKHDLAALATRKPGLVEDRLNAGSDAALGLLERITRGSAPRDAGPAAPADQAGAPAPTAR